VQICGLQGKPELNGKYGTATTIDPETGRWIVRLQKGECIKIKVANIIPAIAADAQDDDDEGLQKVIIDGKEALVNPRELKRQFDLVTSKYNLNVGDKAQRIATFLTDSSERTQVSVDEFAQRFEMERDDASVYMMYINMMVSFKEQWMDAKGAGL